MNPKRVSLFSMKRKLILIFFLLTIVSFASDVMADSISLHEDGANQTCHVCVCGSHQVVPTVSTQSPKTPLLTRLEVIQPIFPDLIRFDDIFHPPKKLA